MKRAFTLTQRVFHIWGIAKENNNLRLLSKRCELDPILVCEWKDKDYLSLDIYRAVIYDPRQAKKKEVGSHSTALFHYCFCYTLSSFTRWCFLHVKWSEIRLQFIELDHILEMFPKDTSFFGRIYVLRFAHETFPLSKSMKVIDNCTRFAWRTLYHKLQMEENVDFSLRV